MLTSLLLVSFAPAGFTLSAFTLTDNQQLLANQEHMEQITEHQQRQKFFDQQLTPHHPLEELPRVPVNLTPNNNEQQFGFFPEK